MLDKSLVTHCAPTLASLKTGSLFTVLHLPEESLCQQIDHWNFRLKGKGVPFVDSMTTAKSLGKAVAAEKGVALLERDVFLDSTDSVAVVKDNLRKAGEVALEKGAAIAIGHVGPEGGKITAQAIKEAAPELERAGITFVTVSELAK